MPVSISGSTGYSGPLGAITVDTAAIAANAVTPAKMSRTGTAGQVLTSNGSGSDPSYQTAGTVTSVSGSGGLTGTVTTSGSLSIDTSTYAIGQIISGRPANNTNYTVGSTVAGSSLYTTPTGYVRSTGGQWGISTFFGSTNGPAAPTLINTGTWKCISPAFQVSVCELVGMCGMWVRIS